MKLITLSSIRAYVSLLSTQGLTESGIQEKLVHLRLFVEWAAKSNYILPKETQEILEFLNTYHVTPKETPQVVAEKVVEQIIEAKAAKPEKRIAMPIMAVLLSGFMIMSSFIGYGIYNRFYGKNQSTFAYPTTQVRAGRNLSFQGRLTDTLGNPIVAMTNVTFKLYNVSSGGSALYTGTCTGGSGVTPDSDGIFNTLIGSDCGMTEIPNSVFTENANIYLGITVGSDPEMTPRQQIANVGYAINSETLQGLPPGSTTSTIPFINSQGDMLIATSQPGIRSIFSSATFTVSSANTAVIQSAGSGDVVLQATQSGALKFRTGGTADANNQMIVTNSGNVGIGAGVTTASQQLEVNGNIYANGGQIRIGNFAVAPTSIGAGSLYYDTISQQVYYNNGTSWTAFGTGSGSSYWTQLLGALSPANSTVDMLIGGQSSASAKFAFLNVNSGTPVASFAANLSLNGSNRTIGTDLFNTLTLGSATTGNVQISPAGAVAVIALQNGSVGIGTTTPATKLDVNGSAIVRTNLVVGSGTFSSTNIPVRINGTVGNLSNNYGFYDDSTKTFSGSGTESESFDSLHSLDTTGSNFNVTNDYGYRYRATTKLGGGTVTNAYGIYLAAPTLATNNYSIYAAGNSILAATSGNAGIGTITPLAKLDVNGTASVGGNLTFYAGNQIQSSAFQTLTIGGNTTGNITLNPANAAVGGAVVPNTTNVTDLGQASLQFRSVYAQTLYQNGNAIIDASSMTGTLNYISKFTGPNTLGNSLLFDNGTNVGIGTALPGAKLEVNGTIKADALVDTVGAGAYYLDLANGSNSLVVAGNVGIGSTSPAEKLDVNGNATAAGNLTLSGGARTIATRSLNSLILGDNQTGNIILNPNGNIGIGSTVPAAKLDVNGNILVQANGTFDTSGAGTLTIGGTTQTGLILGRTGQTTRIANLVTNGVMYTSGANGTLNTEAQLSSVRGGTGADLSAATQGSISYFSATGVMSALAPATAGYVLTTNGVGANPTWTAASGIGTNYWTQANGALYPNNSTVDFFVGGTSTSSAHFAVLNNNTGTPVASIAGNMTLSGANRTIGTDSFNTLKLGDATTGNILIAPAGTTAITAAVGGNVGIGTTAPGAALDVAGAGTGLDATQGTLKLMDTRTSTTGTGGQIGFLGYRNGVTQPTGFATIWGAKENSTLGDYASYLGFGTRVNGGNIIEQLRISSTGNLGIGTTTPRAKLDVNGTASIGGALTFYATNQIQSSAFQTLTIGGTTTGNIVLNPANAAAGGAVVPNTTNVTDIGQSGLQFRNLYAQTLYQNGNAVVSTSATGTLNYISKFTAANTLANSQLYDDGTNVGIGTALPGAKLEVNGIIRADALVDTVGAGAYFLDPANGAASLVVAGNVGIGSTSPAEKLDVNGNATAAGNLTLSGGARTIATRSLNTLTLGDSQTGNVILNPNGNIGIGSLAPTEKLEVNGNIHIQANGTFDTTSAGTLTIGGTTQTGLILGRTGQTTRIANLATNGVVYTSGANGTLNTEAQLSAVRGGTGADLSAATKGSIPFFSALGVMSALPPTTAGYVLTTNGAGADPTWTPGSGIGTNYWTQANGALYPNNSTVDLLVGGNSSASAKFAFLNNNSGTPVASIAGNLSLNGGNRTIGTDLFNTLTFGSASTGNIQLAPAGSAALTALQNGSIGIGTTTPATKLDVNGSAIVRTNMVIGSGTFSSTNIPVRINGTVGNLTNNYGFYDDSTKTFSGSGTEAESFDSLHVVDTTGSNFNVTNDYGYRYRATTKTGGGTITNAYGIYLAAPTVATNNYSIYAAGNSILSAASGNTGIGTITPLAKLDVNGTASIGGSLTFYATNQIQSSAFQTLTIGGTTTGNIVLNPANAAAGGAVVPNTTNVTDIGQSGLQFRNIYAQAFFKNGNAVLDTTNVNGIANRLARFTGANTLGSSTVYDDGTNVGVGAAAGAYKLDVTGTLRVTSTTNFGGVDYTWPGTSGTAGFVLTSNGAGALSWTDSATQWIQNANGTLYPKNSTVDLLVGGQSSASAKFAFLNNAGGTPVASIAGNLSLNGGNRTIGTDLFNMLTIGSATTGNIILAPNGVTALTAMTGGNIGIGITPTANILQLASGTTAAAGIGFGTDTNLYRFNTNVLKTDDTFITAGNIGVGTNTPLEMLDVNGNASAGGNMTLYGGARTIATRAMNTLTIGDNQTGNVVINPGGNVTPPFTITPSGNIGIGSPVIGYKLAVQGSILADAFVDTVGSGAYFLDPAAGGTSLSVAGNVGINNTTPGEKLDIVGNATISGNLTFYGGGGTIASRLNTTLAIGDSQTGIVLIQPGSTLLNGTPVTGLAVATNASVGIGTVSPLQKLTVQQDLASDLFGIKDGPTYTDFLVADGGAITSRPTQFDKVFRYDGVSAYTDNSTEAATRLGTPFSIFSTEGSSNDLFYVGLDHPFSSVYFDIATAGSTIGLTAEYWNGAAWTALTISDGTSNLSVDGAVTFTAPGAWAPTAVNSSTKYWIRLKSTGSNITTAPTANSVSPTTGSRLSLFAMNGDSAPTVYVNDLGNVGIGSNTPSDLALGRFFVKGSIVADSFVDSVGAGVYFLDPANGATSLRIAGNATIDGSTLTMNNGSTAIIDSGSKTLVVNSSAGTALCVGDAATCSGKVDAGTIDPPYTINGKKYATYMASMTGVKEETAGNIPVSEYVEGKGYKYTIDFDSQPEGSDLWLFSKTTNLQKNISKLVALLTPSNNAKTWYEVDGLRQRLTLYSSRPTTLSYRLTAPRFDYERWGNNREEGASGFIINDQDAPLTMTSAGNIMEGQPPVVAKNTDGTFTLKDSTGSVIEEVTTASKAFVANLTAGVIKATDVIVNGSVTIAGNLTALTANFGKITVAEKIISPVIETGDITATGTAKLARIETNEIKGQNGDVTININSDQSASNSEVQSVQQNPTKKGNLAKVIFKGLEGKTVTTIDAAGNIVTSGDINAQNASISGQITSTVIIANDVKAQNATISGTLAAKDASIGGNLIAKEIHSDNINNLESQVGSLNSRMNSIQTNSPIKSMDELNAQMAEVQKLLGDIQNQPLPNPAYYQNIGSDVPTTGATGAATIATNLTGTNVWATGSINASQAVITDSLNVSNILVRDNSIESITSELKLSALNQITLFDGQVTIAKNGTITTKGEIIAEGGVRTNQIKATSPEKDIAVVLGENTQTGDKSKLEIKDSVGTTVASVDASGSASFKNVALDKYLEATSSSAIIAAADNFHKNGLNTPAIETQAQSAGIGLLPENEQEVAVYNNSLKDSSLIYITPMGESNGQLTVVKKESCSAQAPSCKPYFTVSSGAGAHKEVKFNWLIIN